MCKAHSPAIHWQRRGEDALWYNVQRAIYTCAMCGLLGMRPAPTCSANRSSMLATRSSLYCSSSGAPFSSISDCAQQSRTAQALHCLHHNSEGPCILLHWVSMFAGAPASVRQHPRRLGSLHGCRARLASDYRPVCSPASPLLPLITSPGIGTTAWRYMCGAPPAVRLLQQVPRLTQPQHLGLCRHNGSM